MEDLEEAIVYAREALHPCPLVHPLRFRSLYSLALHLSSQYERLGATEDLEEAIVYAREPLDLFRKDILIEQCL